MAGIATAGHLPAEKIYQGFNSGNMLMDRTAKNESDFRKEFEIMQSLPDSPGLFNAVRLYTNIQGYPKTPSIEQEVGIGAYPANLTGFIKDTRDRIKGTLLADKPVGHVDTWLSWMNTSNSEVTEAVDWIGVDIYPFFEKDPKVREFIPGNLSNTIDNAVTFFDALYEVTLNASKGKPVWITETGWPYANKGKSWGQAKASVANQQTYWQEIGCSKLFGRLNTFWYTLRDGNPDSDINFAVVADDMDLGPRFDLTCPAGSGAPATINCSKGKHGSSRG
ncbi:putative glucan endo-1,3-beta-glucosidase eglC [Pseudocercospora fuligena]|uniref:Putative glucan endo-1,3-beta-glucosidase eglC n=1 Tax=Pseudocercospora fuligena TaxID=685502 RepID=A0A8H6VM45_9PEZI|nr:putative glucan endo-1,3-beta-glucosidase eglC [Pseudocercospora fuligena]